MENAFKILLVGNTGRCRVPMALGLFQTMELDQVQISYAAREVLEIPQAVKLCMAQKGIDLSEIEIKPLEQLGREAFDLVITLGGEIWQQTGEHGHPDEALSSEAKRPLLVGDPIHLNWDVGSPLDVELTAGAEALSATRDNLEQRVLGLVCHGTLPALIQQRRRAHQILDNLEEGIVAHDHFRCISLFNRAAEQITGFSRAQALGQDCHTVFQPDGLCGSSCHFSGAQRGKVGRKVEYEMNIRSKDGVDRRLKMAVRPMKMGAGRFPGILAVMRDITEVSELRQRVNLNNVFHGTVGNSVAMQDIFQTIRQVSTSDYPVQVSGESGTGKELVARAIHAESRRSKGPFVPINCGALPENILESELFGHVRGAFTGAIRDKKGRFELAHKGTLFLDEVGELTPTFQVKLLRVLQEKRFEMVGGERSVTVDVRIISASNRDLRQMVQEGTFREDLFYRLCVVPIDLPPLRERREDLPLLAEHFLKTIRVETGKPELNLSDEALDAVMRHRWPGNVRELINALQFAAIRSPADNPEIAVWHLPPEVRSDATALPPVSQSAPAVAGMESPSGRRFKLDPESVRRALSEAGGNKVQAAKILGVGRATLYRFLSRTPVS